MEKETMNKPNQNKVSRNTPAEIRFLIIILPAQTNTFNEFSHREDIKILSVEPFNDLTAIVKYTRNYKSNDPVGELVSSLFKR